MCDPVQLYLHRVFWLMTLVGLAQEEAAMADVKVEALTAVVAEANNGGNLADLTAHIMGGCLGGGKAVQHG